MFLTCVTSFTFLVVEILFKVQFNKYVICNLNFQNAKKTTFTFVITCSQNLKPRQVRIFFYNW